MAPGKKKKKLPRPSPLPWKMIASAQNLRGLDSVASFGPPERKRPAAGKMVGLCADGCFK